MCNKDDATANTVSSESFTKPIPSVFQASLRRQLLEGLETRRPVLTHLNADTSWLLQIPSPSKAATNTDGRTCFRLLIDPWLKGPQHDVAKWFSRQWHSVATSIQSVTELEVLLQSLDLAVGMKDTLATDAASSTLGSQIDGILISHPFTDHCHKETLLEVDPVVPVFATKRAARLIRSWAHFVHVFDLPTFSRRHADWRAHSQQPLPAWLSLCALSQRHHPLQFHSAILIAFASTSSYLEGNKSTDECIIYTAHGIKACDVELLPLAEPRLSTLALMHGLHNIKISLSRLNLGGRNGMRVQEIIKAKHWIATHDEVKTAKGLIVPLLKRKAVPLRRSADQLTVTDQVECKQLASGESIVLF